MFHQESYEKDGTHSSPKFKPEIQSIHLSFFKKKGKTPIQSKQDQLFQYISSKEKKLFQYRLLHPTDTKITSNIRYLQLQRDPNRQDHLGLAHSALGPKPTRSSLPAHHTA